MGITVFTNGCFDLFHDGHRHLLTEAAALGTHLTVALNSDQSIRELKGVGRPIDPLTHRMNNVREFLSLTLKLKPYTYAVIAFNDLTPAFLVATLRPDILVKGEDAKGRPIPGEAFAGSVVFVPLLPGISTSLLLQKRNAPPS